MSTNPNAMNQGDRQHGRKLGSGWGEGCPVFDRLWGRADGASLDYGEDEVGGLGDERSISPTFNLEMSLTGMCTNHRFDSFALAPLDFTIHVDTELQELGNLACSNRSSLSYFQLPDQNALALSLSQLHDDSRDPAFSALWTAPDSLTTPGYMACTMTEPGGVTESSISPTHRNTDGPSMVGSQTTPECTGREEVPPHGDSLYPQRNPVQPSESLEGDAISKAPPSKKRLSCQHPGCKKTFSRKWELERHTRHKHEKSEDYHCYVYGCNRTSKPIGRLDKFREHWRTHHKRAERLICIFDDCRRGPFVLHEFKEHIQDQHAALMTQEDHLNELLMTLNLQRVTVAPRSTWLGKLRGCPLGFLGCDFSASGPHYFGMSAHLETHDIVERSLGHEVIRSWLTFYPNLNHGIAHCPLCEEKWGAERTYDGDVLLHVAAHTRESRSPHLKELYDMFQPYLLKKDTLYGSRSRDNLAILQIEIEEAGLLPASTTPTND